MRNGTSRAAVLLVAVAVLVAGAQNGGASRTADEVTLALRVFTNANRMRVLVFTGAVASAEPRQDVEIVGQDCGVRGYRLIAATQTTAGGAYQAENPQQNPPAASAPWSSGITFRARWNGHLSRPIQYRLPAPLSAVRVRGRTWKVYFNPYDIRARMEGKLVVLQRFSSGRWVRSQSARLKLKPSLELGAFNHEAEFTVPERGVRLRAFLPARSAAPCWAAGASEPWRS